jgi:hypothetical protein
MASAIPCRKREAPFDLRVFLIIEATAIFAKPQQFPHIFHYQVQTGHQNQGDAGYEKPTKSKCDGHRHQEARL